MKEEFLGVYVPAKSFSAKAISQHEIYDDNFGLKCIPQKQIS